MAKRDPRLRAFVKVDKYGQVVPSTLILRRKPPESGRSHYWIEIEGNVCCSVPLSSWEFNDGSILNDGILLITVGGAIIVNATNTEAGTFTTSAGQPVVVTISGSGPAKTLLVVDNTSGVVLSNQTGTTGNLTFTYTSAGDIYSIIATQNPTTTTTTTTTTTSTTTTSTTSTSTTTTSTTSTTTTSTTVAAGSLRVVNNHAAPSGVTITAVGPGTSYTGGTFPVAAAGSTSMTLVNSTAIDTTVTIAASTIVGTGSLSLFKDGLLIETLGPITAVGTYTFGPISFTTADNLEVVFS